MDEYKIILRQFNYDVMQTSTIILSEYKFQNCINSVQQWLLGFFHSGFKELRRKGKMLAFIYAILKFYLTQLFNTITSMTSETF